MNRKAGSGTFRAGAISWLLCLAALAAAAIVSRDLIREGLGLARGDMAWSSLRSGDLPRAIGLFLRAGALAPGRSEVDRGLGEAYFSLYRRQPRADVLLAKAQVHFRQALLSSPADAGLLMRYHQARLAQAHISPEEMAARFDEAARLAEAHEQDTLLQTYFLGLAADVAGGPGRGTGILDRESRKAALVRAATRLVHADASNLGLIVPLIENGVLAPGETLAITEGSEGAGKRLAVYLIDGGRWAAEETDYLRAAGSEGRSLFLRTAAGVLAERRRRAEAAALMEIYLARNPGDASAHVTAAALLSAEGAQRWPQAAFHLATAATLDPGNARVRLAHGVQLYRQGDYTASLSELEEAGRLEPGGAEAVYYQGQALARLGRAAEARDRYALAARLAPKNKKYLRAASVGVP